MTSIGKSGFSTLCLALWFIFGELRDSDETPRNLNIVYANLGGVERWRLRQWDGI